MKDFFIEKQLYSLFFFDPKFYRIKDAICAAILWVIYLDAFHETLDSRWEHKGNSAKDHLISLIPSDKIGDLNDLSIPMINSYFNFERDTLYAQNRGVLFSVQEGLHFIMRKSEDAVIYGTIISYFTKFDGNNIKALHFIQALDDIEDNIVDVEEDESSNQPNLLTMLVGKRNPQESLCEFRYRAWNLVSVVVSMICLRMYKLEDVSADLVHLFNLKMESINSYKPLYSHPER